MNISYIDVKNFRKLESCRIELTDSKTIFVGSNNSGKTSAMTAVSRFIKQKKSLRNSDITLSKWIELEKIALSWVTGEERDISVEEEATLFMSNLPHIDVQLSIETGEKYHLHGAISSLASVGKTSTYRVIYAPKKYSEMIDSYVKEYKRKEKILQLQEVNDLKLWPANLKDFLDEKMDSIFEYKSFVLNPSTLPNELEASKESFIKTMNDAKYFKKNLIGSLIKVSFISASRMLADSDYHNINSNTGKGRLSNQFRNYYEQHLNPQKNLSVSDLGALKAISDAQTQFDKDLTSKFEPALDELKNMGYPGVSSPSIILSSKVEPIKGLSHESAIQYVLNSQDDEHMENQKLPEQYNGLGYQNLISMVFDLIQFRTDWIKIESESDNENTISDKMEPIHLVLIEEPEAHLHVQVQQVFIKKAMDVLKNDEILNGNPEYKTQLVVSTHSSAISHEVEFSNLRYFERVPQENNFLPLVCVKNLKNVFGKDDITRKFVSRYMRITHCDLFFADAIVMVEGSAEKMLVPYFIEKHYKGLSSSYITVLELGGSHAHRFKPLIETLNIPTLIITDLDSVKGPNDNGKYSSHIPLLGEELKTSNNTIKKWIPAKDEIDDLVKLENKLKTKDNVRVCYQSAIKFKQDEREYELIANTFEDALFYTNFDFFKDKDGIGLVSKFSKITKIEDSNEILQKTHEAIRIGGKGEFALDLLLDEKVDEIKVPQYINEGLIWLENEIENRRASILIKDIDKITEVSTDE